MRPGDEDRLLTDAEAMFGKGRWKGTALAVPTCVMFQWALALASRG